MSRRSCHSACGSNLPSFSGPSFPDYRTVSVCKTGHRVELSFSWQIIGLILI